MGYKSKRGYRIQRGYCTKNGETRFTIGSLALNIKANGETLVDDECTPLYVFDSLDRIKLDDRVFVVCKNGHRRHVKVEQAIKGKCRPCATLKWSIDDLVKYAIAQGGKCLSDAYTNNHHKYQWECHFGHIWSASWHDVRRKKTWCPACAARIKGENRRTNSRIRRRP